MSVPVLQSIADKTGKSLDTLEGYWKEAKASIAKQTGKSVSEFGDSEWAQVTAVTKKMAGLTESKTKEELVSRKLSNWW